MSTFEDLVLELYDKHNSAEYMINNEYTFFASIRLHNYRCPLNQYGLDPIPRRVFEERVKDVQAVYIQSNMEEFNKQITRSEYRSHRYSESGDILRLKTRDKKYKIRLK